MGIFDFSLLILILECSAQDSRKLCTAKAAIRNLLGGMVVQGLDLFVAAAARIRITTLQLILGDYLLLRNVG